MAVVFAGVLLYTTSLSAHLLTFNSTVTYSDSQPTDGTDDISNWTGAAFDADNIGGSGNSANGLVDDVRVYNRSLTQQGIQDIATP